MECTISFWPETGICVLPSSERPDPLFQFSHWIFKIKVIILEIVIFIGFLMFMWEKVKKDVIPLPQSLRSRTKLKSERMTNREFRERIAELLR